MLESIKLFKTIEIHSEAKFNLNVQNVVAYLKYMDFINALFEC